MKLRKLLIPFTIIASLTALVLSGCGRHHQDPEDKAEWIVHKVSKKLDLNEQQKVKLEAIKTEIMTNYKKHYHSKTQMMDTLLTEIPKSKINPSLLMDMLKQHQTRVDEVAPGVISKLVEFHASLTDEQKQKLTKKLEKFRKYHQHNES